MVCASLSGCCHVQTVTEQSADKEIRQSLDDSVAAWNRGDLDEFMAPYAKDARFVTKKQVTYGSNQILSRYRKKYSSKALMGVLAIKVQHITFNPGHIRTAATVIGRWTITRASGQVVEGATLIVYHRIGAQWLIVEDHSS